MTPPDLSCADTPGGHGDGKDAAARERQAGAAEQRALVNQARGVGDVKKAAAMQAAAGVEQWFGASRADALRERIQRSKAASACSSQRGDVTQKEVSAYGEVPHGDNALGDVLAGCPVFEFLLENLWLKNLGAGVLATLR